MDFESLLIQYEGIEMQIRNYRNEYHLGLVDYFDWKFNHMAFMRQQERILGQMLINDKMPEDIVKKFILEVDA